MIFRPYNVFISYSIRDLDLVRGLKATIEDFCPSAYVFVAEYDIQFGEDLALAVYSELIEKTDTVVLLWTTHSEKSDWVRSEAAYSKLFSKHIVQIKMNPDVHIAETLQNLKYASAYRFNIIKDCFFCVARQIAKRIYRQGLCKRLLLQALRSRYSFSRDDDSFYRFACGYLKKGKISNSLFMSGSPVTVLPSEAYTEFRREYLDLLLYRFTKRPGTSKVKYLFNQSRTYARLMANLQESEEFERHMSRVEPLLRSPNFEFCGSRNLDFLPSGLIDENSAAIVLKDPSMHSRTVGVYFLKGKQVNNILRQLLPIMHPTMLIPGKIWLPELRELVSKRLATIK
ncbi:MAG: toll/interleukin-1 receptor domain-containing protein [Phycisphaerae bacterium]